MKRVKILLSKWLLKLSKKLHSKSENVSVKSHPNIDKISAKFEISDDLINSYAKSVGPDFLKREINYHLAIKIANEILEKYANKIKSTENTERRSVTYFCDICLYNPQESDIK